MTTLYKAHTSQGVIYVGVTDNFEKRKSQHRSRSWFEFVDRWELESFETREEALRREREEIARLRPPGNRAGNPRGVVFMFDLPGNVKAFI